MTSLHPFGPATVVAFLVDGDGPYSLDSMVEANTGQGIDEDPEILAWLRVAAPGDVFYAGIGGGWTRLDAVLSPGFEYEVWNDTDEIPAAPEAFAAREGAEAFVAEFPSRFEGQGYYRTATGHRIDPREVLLRVEEVPVDEERWRP